MVTQQKPFTVNSTLQHAPTSSAWDSMYDRGEHRIYVQAWRDGGICYTLMVPTKHGSQWAKVWADGLGIYAVEIQSHSHPDMMQRAWTAWGEKCSCWASANNHKCYHLAAAHEALRLVEGYRRGQMYRACGYGAWTVADEAVEA